MLDKTPTAQWAPRDASWYRHPRTTGVPRWHVLRPDGASACRLIPVLDIAQASIQAPSETMECRLCAGWLIAQNEAQGA